MAKEEKMSGEPHQEVVPETENVRNDEGSNAILVEAFHDHLPPLSEVKRFTIVGVAIFGCICASFAHFFNLFSGELQKEYALSQRDLSTISTVGTVFCFFTLPYGFVYDYFGPIPIFCIAATMFPLGSLLLALSFNGFIYGTVARLSVFNAILNIGTIMFDFGCQMTLLSIFPSSRGAIVAIGKTFNGLGSPIVGTIQLAFFDNHPDHFFYFLMVFVVVVSVACMFFLRLPPYHLTGYQQSHLSETEKTERLATRAQYLRQKTPVPRFLVGITFVILFIIFLPTQGALVAYLELGYKYRLAFAITTIVLVVMNAVIIALPLKVLDRSWWENRRRNRSTISDGLDRIEEDLEYEPIEDKQDKSEENKQKKEVETDVDYIAPQFQTTFLQSVCTLRLWAILWSLFATVGAETVIMLNARFIFAALSGSPVSNSMGTLLTVLDGVSSAVGRLLVCAFEIWSQKKKPEDRIPMTVTLFVPSSTMIVALVLILVVPKSALPLPYVVSALANGIRAGVVVLLIRTIYKKDAARHYNFCFLSTVFATILLNRFAYGEWYTREAEKLGTPICYNRKCVLMPLLLMLGINCTAFISTVYVHISYVRFSRKVLEERRRIKENAIKQKADAAHGSEDGSNENK